MLRKTIGDITMNKYKSRFLLICILTCFTGYKCYSQKIYPPKPTYTPYVIKKLNHTFYSSYSNNLTSATTANKTPTTTKTSNTVNDIPVVTPVPTPTQSNTPIPVTPVPTNDIPPTPKPLITPVTPVSIIADIIPTPYRKIQLTSNTETSKTETRTVKVQKPFEEQWITNYETAYKQAIKNNQKILVFIGFEKCHFCKELRKDIQSLYVGNYQTVYVDREKNNQYKTYFSNYKLAPALLMIDSSNSKIIKKIIGYQHSDFKKLAAFIND